MPMAVSKPLSAPIYIRDSISALTTDGSGDKPATVGFEDHTHATSEGSSQDEFKYSWFPPYSQLLERQLLDSSVNIYQPCYPHHLFQQRFLTGTLQKTEFVLKYPTECP
jgi:hypothetical protein